jgi:nitrogen fixation protein NifU and related proteins
MDDLYRDEILEHYRQPHNFGSLDAPDATWEGSNPLCGDRITMMLGLDEDGVVRDVAFSGRGCAISQASASLLTDEIKGRSVAEIRDLGSQDVLDLLGIEISPARLKCALLSLDTLQRAVGARGGQQPGGGTSGGEQPGGGLSGGVSAERPSGIPA